MSSAFRVRILCEDRLSERFLRRLCDRFRVRVVDVAIAPRGAGAASAWVRARFPEVVRLRRSKNFQQNLGLLVHIDGDNRGPHGRKQELHSALRTCSPMVAVIAPEEPVAVFVPTWSIETWLLHLSGLGHPPETVRLTPNSPPEYQSAMKALREDELGTVKTAVEGWPQRDISSLADAALQGKRIGL